LIAALDLPRALLPELVDPGTAIGTWKPGIDVLTVGSHDTASAVVAVPATEPDFAYISCGTWGLVGVELAHPVVTQDAREANFTNERGVDGRIRFLHNVMGLWLLTETLSDWGVPAEGLPALLAQSAQVTADVPIFDPNDPMFVAPGGMPDRIATWLRRHDLPVPATPAALIRCIVESLATAFAESVTTASRLSGRPVSVIHIVGGGSQNELLCQRTADRSGLPVLAGPVEATALGNVLVQSRANGDVSGSLESLRELVLHSFPPRRYQPRS
jgi:rhamnulokinase